MWIFDCKGIGTPNHVVFKGQLYCKMSIQTTIFIIQINGRINILIEEE